MVTIIEALGDQNQPRYVKQTVAVVCESRKI